MFECLDSIDKQFEEVFKPYSLNSGRFGDFAGLYQETWGTYVSTIEEFFMKLEGRNRWGQSEMKRRFDQEMTWQSGYDKAEISPLTHNVPLFCSHLILSVNEALIAVRGTLYEVSPMSRRLNSHVVYHTYTGTDCLLDNPICAIREYYKACGPQ